MSFIKQVLSPKNLLVTGLSVVAIAALLELVGFSGLTIQPIAFLKSKFNAEKK